MNMAELMKKKLDADKAPKLDITFPFFEDISLMIGPVLANCLDYPSSKLQKGLILIANDQELAEEGVGFGVPVLKQGVRTIFAGEIDLTWLNDGSQKVITAVFLMNLEERLVSEGRGKIRSESLYQVKNHLADLYRRVPLLRSPLTSLSNLLRSSFGWRTVYEDTRRDLAVKVNYSIDFSTRIITVAMDTTGAPLGDMTEVILMNEQGAHYFDTYSDVSGLLLQGDEIGGWDLVTSENASFLSRTQRLAFTLQQIDGACLYRGRELVDSRLAWSGFGYSLHPSKRHFIYPLRVGRPA
jgi:hypothetical protein